MVADPLHPVPPVGHAADRPWSRRDTEGGLLFYAYRSSDLSRSRQVCLLVAGFARRVRQCRFIRYGEAECGHRRRAVPESPGRDLVVLTDDKHLQQSDNVVPAINKAVANNPARSPRWTRSRPTLDTHEAHRD